MENLICEKNEITLIDIRRAMASGAKTVQEVSNLVNLCGTCGCKDKAEVVLQTVCRCKNISTETIISTIQSGATTLEEVMLKTEAGTKCGKCQIIITNFLEQGK